MILSGKALLIQGIQNPNNIGVKTIAKTPLQKIYPQLFELLCSWS